ncbi:YadA-like family protein [Halomonas sabkhae]|nr:YadA-like family protein [Halomonas sabkhae]MDN3526240.1 YadA-like family protein [Halomonas sabkhae]
MAFGNNTEASEGNAIAFGDVATASGISAIAMGTGATADTEDAVAIGTNASATNGKAVSIGAENVASGDGAVAIGDPNTATGNGAVAQGMDNTATGDGTVALGNTNMVGGGGQAVGSAGTAAQGAVGIGYQNEVIGQGSVALGNTSSALDAGTVAIGDTAEASVADSVALGSGSLADGDALGDAAFQPLDATGTPIAVTAPTATSEVSVGDAGSERRITNVAAGSADTDAVNVSQLAAVDQKAGTPLTFAGDSGTDVDRQLGETLNVTGGSTGTLTNGNIGVEGDGSDTLAIQLAENIDLGTNGSVTTGNSTLDDSGLAVDDGSGNVTTVTNDGLTVANGGPSVTNSGGIDAGGQTVSNVAAPVNGDDALNLDYFDENRTRYYSVNDDGVQGGNYDNDGATGVNAIAAGVDASAVGNGGIAMGYGAFAQQADSVAIGTDAESLAIDSIALGPGASNDVFGNQQIAIGSNASSFGTNDLAIGTDAAASGQRNIALGTEASTETGLFDGIAIGTDAYVGADDGIAMGNGASADHAGSVALGLDSVTAAPVGTTDITLSGTNYTFAGGTPTGTVSVGDVGNERTLTNVAAGRISASSTDAINGSQLFATNQAVEEAADTANQGWNLSAQDGGATNVAPDGEVNLRNADGNLEVTQATANGREEVTFDLANEVSIGTDGPTLNDDGIDMDGDTITNVGTPTNGGDAANKTYVDDTSDALIAQGMDFTGNDNSAGDVHRDLGQTLAITGEASAGGTYSGENLQTVTDPATGAIQLQMTDAPQFGDVTINEGDSGRIGGVADGQDADDAVNVGQLEDVSDVANAGWNLSAQDGMATNVAPDGEVNLRNADGNLEVTQATANGREEVTFDLANEVSIGTDGPTLNDDGIDMGGDTITNVGDPVDGGDAVNLDYFDENRTHYYSVNDGGTQQDNYANDGAEGVDSLAAGVAASTGAGAERALALGYNTSATGVDSVAIGQFASADSGGSVAIGRDATANGGQAISIGYGNTATGDGAVSIGDPSTAIGDGALALGKDNYAEGTGAVAVGNNNTSEGDGALAIGDSNTADGNGSITMGVNNQATGDGAVAMGNDNMVTGDGAFAVGNNATSGALDTLALGTEASATSQHAMALGNSSDASALNAFAAGNTAEASGENSMALGQMSLATGLRSSAIGLEAVANAEDALSVGTEAEASGLRSTTLGNNSVAAGQGSSALGSNADAQAFGSMAIGARSTAVHEQSVALGGASRTVRGPQDNYVGYGLEAPQTSKGELAIGQVAVFDEDGNQLTEPGERQITGVAAGSADTDAVNVSQLKGIETHYYSVNDDGVIGGNYDNDGATGVNALAGGVGALASADGATSLGFGAQATIEGSVALGSGSVANRALAPASGAIPAGSATITYNTTDKELLGAVSVGDSDSYRQITNVADGTQSQDAVTVRQLQGAIGSVIDTGTKYFHANSDQPDSLAVGEDSIAVGPTTVVNGDAGIGMGNGATVGQMAPGGTAIGDGAEVMLADGMALGTESLSEAEQGVALGTGATVSHDQSVALGSNSVTAEPVATPGTTIAGTDYDFAGITPDSTVSVGDVGAERTITNVAAGRLSADSTDAVNGSQLFATNQAVENASQGWDLSAQGADTTNVAPGDAVDLANTDGNLVIAKNATDGAQEAVTFDLADEVTIGTDGPTLNDDGIDMDGDTITNVGDPVNEGDAVNKQYVDRAGDELTAEGINFSGNEGDVVHRDLGQTLAVTGEATAGGTYSGGNLKTVTDPDTGAIQLQMTDAPQFGDVTINADDSGQVSGVADGAINEDSADAVNGSQLWETQQALEEGQTHYYSVNDGGTQGDNYANDGATGVNAIAAGVDAEATADGAVAMGDGATASEVGSVALGSGATTEAAVGTADITVGGQTYAFAGASPVGTLSVGSAGAERTITNVAAGRVSAQSTDAINGSQLYATNQAVESVEGRVGNVEGDVTDLQGSVSDIDGRVTNVEGDVSNLDDEVSQLDDQAVKYDSNDDGSTNYDSITLEGDGGTTITNVADGDVSESSSDAVNGGQLWEVQEQVTNINEEGSKYFKANSEAADARAEGAESVAMGPESVARGDHSVATGDGAVAESEGGVALGAGSQATREGMNGAEEAFSGESVASTQGAVSVGSEGGERQITNVAGGTQATDAVNVRQLESVQAGAVNYDRNDDGSVDYSSVTMGQEGTPTQIHNVAAGEAPTDAANVGQLQDLNRQFSQQIDGLGNRINKVEDNANAGSASAIAAASVPQAYLPGKSMVSAGAGTYNGESAVSVGASRLSDNGRWVVKLNATGDSQGNFGAGVGAGFHW